MSYRYCITTTAVTGSDLDAKIACALELAFGCTTRFSGRGVERVVLAEWFEDCPAKSTLALAVEYRRCVYKAAGKYIPTAFESYLIEGGETFFGFEGEYERMKADGELDSDSDKG